jgi:hypothetical protein
MTAWKHRWNPFSISFEKIDLGLTVDEVMVDLDHGWSASDEGSTPRVEASAA